jgi:hypothetical protein
MSKAYKAGSFFRSAVLKAAHGIGYVADHAWQGTTYVAANVTDAAKQFTSGAAGKRPVRKSRKAAAPIVTVITKPRAKRSTSRSTPKRTATAR